MTLTASLSKLLPQPELRRAAMAPLASQPKEVTLASESPLSHGALPQPQDRVWVPYTLVAQPRDRARAPYALMTQP